MTSRSPEQGNARSHSSNKGILLVVDDSPRNLQVLCSFLDEVGFEVWTAHSGEEALKKLDCQLPDLIILDVMMPGMNGFETCEKLKENPQTRDIPVIFMTALSDTTEKVRGLNLGAVDYITKPFQQKEVLARVENQLRICRLQRQLAEQNARLQQEIQQRQHIELQLSNSDKLNRSILNSAPVGMCLNDEDGYFLAVNPAYCQLYGFAAEELLGQLFTIHFPHFPYQIKLALIKEYKQFIKDFTSYQSGEYTVCRKDGSELVVDITRNVFQQEDGKFCVVTTVKDISEKQAALRDRQRAEEKLRASEARLAMAQKIAHIGSWEFDTITGKINWSEEKLRIFGLDPIQPEPTYPELLELIHSEDRLQFHQSFQEAVTKGTPYIYDFRIVRPNGTIRYLETRGEAVFNCQGEVIRLSGTAMDITDRKLTEIALEQELHRSKLLRQITEQIRSQLDPKAVFESAATQIGQTFGVSRCNILIYQTEPISKLLIVSEYLAGGYSSLMNIEIPIIGNPHAEKVLSQDCAIASKDVYADPLLQNAQGICSAVQIKSMLVVRTSYKGEPNGIIGLHQCDIYREWTAEEIELIEAIAAQLGIAIAQAQLLEQEKEAKAELDRQNQALRLIVQGTAAQIGSNFFRSCVRHLAEVLQVRYALIAQLGDRTSLKAHTLAFWNSETWEDNFEYNLTGTPCQVVLNGNKCFYPENIQTLFPDDPYLIALNAQSYLGIPLTDSNGRILGLLAVMDSQPMVSDPVKDLILQIFGARAGAELERQQIEKALEESEYRLRAVFNSSFQFTGILQPDGTLVGANQTALDFAGVEEKDVIGKPFWKAPWWRRSPKNKNLLKQAIKRAASGECVRYEVDVIGAGDTVITIDFSIKPVYDENGELILLIPEGRDITERKQTEKQLQQQAAAIASATDGIAILNSQGEYIYLNEAHIKIFGYDSADELLGKSWELLYERSELERLALEFAPVVFQQGHFCAEARGQRRDGTTFPHEVSVTLIESGERICIVRDISDRKQVEVAVQHQLKCEQLVSSIQERIRSSLDLEEILTTAVNEVRQFLSTDRVLIYRIWPNGTRSSLTESVESGLPTTLGRIFPEEMFPPEFQQQYSQGQVFYLEDIDKAEISSSFADYARQFGVKSKLVVPILKDSAPWGLLIAHHCQKSRQWHAWEIEFLRQITLQLAIAIQQAALYEQAKAEIIERKKVEEALRESAEREKAIVAAVQRIRQSLDIETIFAATTEELRQVIDCDRVAIYRFNRDWSGQFVAESIASHNQSFSFIQKQQPTIQLTFKEQRSPNCRVEMLPNSSNIWDDTYFKETQGFGDRLDSGSLVVEDIYQAGFSHCYLKRLEQFQIRAYIIVPIFCGSKFWGLLAAYQNYDSRKWKRNEINIVIQIGNQLGVALQQAELLEQTKRQSQALQQAVFAADAANRAKSEFLASMSHELRTPLNAILGFTQVMSFDSSLSQTHQDNLAIIDRAGEHLLTLINDVLEMSKIEAGRTTLNQVSFNLISLLENLDKMLQLKAVSKGLQLVFEYPSDLPPYVETDVGKLRQILLNLLGNAIKFTEKGRVTLRVKLNTTKNASQLPIASQQSLITFEIEDTGQGIAPEEIPVLFEPFVQTETGRKSQQGTGLGLPISRKYVQMMGGDIRVNSTPNVGSLFAFDIQVNLPSIPESESQLSQDKRAIGLVPNRQNYRILVVDDTLDSRLLITKLLQPIGFEIKEASKGIEAIEIWENWQPHLIFMDMRMPMMDGYEVTKQIRKKEKERAEIQENLPLPMTKTVIIALTASAFQEQPQLLLSVGCDDLIRKPFSVNFFLRKISQFLGVEYVYEENTESKQSTEELNNVELSDLPNYLAQMPSEWVERVYNAATECRDNIILELIDKMPLDNAILANALTDLANNFQFEKIIKLTQPSA